MDGEPARRRDDPPAAGDHEPPVPAPRPPLRGGALRCAALPASAFGLLVAAAAVRRSGVLEIPHGEAAQVGHWLISAVAVAAIAGSWFAGMLHIVRLAFPARNPSFRGGRRGGWPARLAAFAAAPLPVALFFAGTGLSRFGAVGLVAIAVALALILILAGRRLRGFAECLLLSFFLWMGILLGSTFWRDPVSDQMALTLFGLLGLAGFQG